MVAANLAERGLVVVGDFKQLPPIALAESPLVDRWLKRDVFEASGVKGRWERGELSDSLVPLTVQHRMAPKISAIPNVLYYRRLLTDGEGVEDDAELDGWYSHDHLLTGAAVARLDLGGIDTWAVSVRRGARSSRANPVSAAATVDAFRRCSPGTVRRLRRGDVRERC